MANRKLSEDEFIERAIQQDMAAMAAQFMGGDRKCVGFSLQMRQSYSNSEVTSFTLFRPEPQHNARARYHLAVKNILEVEKDNHIHQTTGGFTNAIEGGEWVSDFQDQKKRIWLAVFPMFDDADYPDFTDSNNAYFEIKSPEEGTRAFLMRANPEIEAEVHAEDEYYKSEEGDDEDEDF